jgi:hypothetical protein
MMYFNFRLKFQHIFLCFIFLMAELVTGVLIWKDSHCDKKDLEIIQERFMEYIRIYGTTGMSEAEEEVVQSATYQLDSIQHGVSYHHSIFSKNKEINECH